jgi:diguanylate cyclase (GGDEF)-like protein/PAS domain S-box-containing protein
VSRTPKIIEDPRLSEILDVIFKFAAGDLKARGTISEDQTALDGVMAGVNILGEELEAHVAEIKRTQDTLRQALDYAETLIRSSPDGILAVDRNFRVTEWNLLMEQMSGMSRERALGQHLNDVPFMKETGEAARVMEFIDGDGAEPREITYRPPGTDKVRFFESLMAPLRSSTGEVLGAIVRIRDIGERRRAEQAEELASRDSLTGLYNHRTFYSLLSEEIARAQRYNRPMSLLMLDIDHFKRINDTYGHQAGDAILKGLSDILVKQARTIDIVCRYGGEEFMAILTETDATAAMIIAERLRLTVEHQRFDIGDQRSIAMTVSIGVVAYPQQACSPEGLVKAVDTALYAAKGSGRNRVCHYESNMAMRSASDSGTSLR